MIDLHVHSIYSDGSNTPEELVMLAKEIGLKAFALTDHDTTDGVDRAIEAAKGSHLTVIPGIEFSTRWLQKDVHILGYFMDYHAEGFQNKLHEFLDARVLRNEKMCAKVREYSGHPITLEALRERFPDAVITRAHMATWLMEQGYVKNRSDAFAKYLGDHAPCFVPKMEVTPEDAVRLILSYGGIPVLAHPLLYALTKNQLDELVAHLTLKGLMGLEAIYSSNKGSDTEHMIHLAQKYGLLITGGSDYHGVNKPGLHLGTGRNNTFRVPDEILESLRRPNNFQGS